MSEKIPNHICKNRFCGKGADGGRKHYFACDYCDRTGNPRSVACCAECFLAYLDQLAESRQTGSPVNSYPERTDKTPEETQALYRLPLSDVKQSTLEDLSAYREDLQTLGLGPTIDNINRELDQGRTSAT